MAEYPSSEANGVGSGEPPGPTNGHASTAPDAETREALRFWGYLFKEDKTGTATLNRLLTGIANYISTMLHPRSTTCSDLLPDQLAIFYRSVGGNYDPLFLETPHSTISFIYKSLGCLHSLQPSPDDDGYLGPSVPALKTNGFVTWQSIQLLLGPEEHVPFLQQAVAKWDIVDPEGVEESGVKQTFPKILPAEAFPRQPDQAMLEWYEDVGARLTREAEHQEREQLARQRQQQARNQRMMDGDADSETEESADERVAAKYFSNPLYRDGDGRPRIVRRFSRPRDGILDRGKGLVHGVRHFITGTSPSNEHGPRYVGRSPSLGDPRRKSYPERRSPANALSPLPRDESPGSLHPGYIPRAERESSRTDQLRRDGRRSQSVFSSDPSMQLSSDSSASDLSPRSSRRPSDSNIHPGIAITESGPSRPELRHRRSDHTPLSPHGSLPPQNPTQVRRHSAHAHSPLYPASPGSDAGSRSQGFFPSVKPLFATQVAHSHRAQSPATSRLHSQSPNMTARVGSLDSRDARDARESRPPAEARDPRDPRGATRGTRASYSDWDGYSNRERPVALRRRSSSGRRRDHTDAHTDTRADAYHDRRGSRSSGTEHPEPHHVQFARDRSARGPERDSRRSQSMEHKGSESTSRQQEHERERNRDRRERDWDRDRDREREPEKDRSKDQRAAMPAPPPPRPRLERHVTPVGGVGGRKYVSPRWDPRAPSGSV